MTKLQITTTQSAAPQRRPRKAAVPIALGVTATEQPRETKGKLGKLILLLSRTEGATIEQMMATTGWQAHSVRGAISGAIKKKLGFDVSSEKTKGGRLYRITRKVA